jgi:hypothetical protein
MYFQHIVEETFFLMAVIDLSDFEIIIVCTYRSPDGSLDIFLKKN